jgi:CheY-like chemotaxis protein
VINKNSDNEPLKTASDLSILLVDDNKVNQFLGKKILKNLGIVNVEVAGDGASALELLRTKNYDVLLTDVEMPGMNGYELTTAVRNLDIAARDITIIALTANASDVEKQFALTNGMNDYLPKPYSPQDLQQVLRKHVVNRTFFLGPETGGNNPRHTTTISGLYKLFNGNKSDIKNLLLLLKQQLPDCLDNLKQQILDENWNEVFHTSHKIKSTVKLLNDDTLFEKVEFIAENAKNIDGRKELIPSNFEELNTGLQNILVLINIEIEMI